MKIINIDQREIQKKKGCAFNPVSCLFLDTLLDHNIDIKKMIVLDTTFGQGKFWLAFKKRGFMPKKLYGADINKWEWDVEPDVFIQKPIWSSYKYVKEQIDLFVLDPPWMTHRRGNEKRFYYGSKYWFGSPELMIREGFKAAAKSKSRYLWVHFREDPENILRDTNGFKPIVKYNFFYISRYISVKANNKSFFGLYEFLLT